MRNFASSPLPLIISGVILFIGLILLVAAGAFLMNSGQQAADQQPTVPISGTNRISIPTATTAPTKTTTPTNTPLPPTVTATPSTPTIAPTVTATVAATRPAATTAPRTNTPNSATTAPTVAPTAASNSKLTNVQFAVENPTVAANSAIWFTFALTNASASSNLQLGKVGVVVLSNGANVHFHTSWTGWVLNASQQQSHRDSVTIGTAGTYQLQLSICFSSVEACEGTGGDWQQMASPITVTVQ